ncbi:MAG: sensor histidine kinase [Bacillota bacterium]
MKLSSKLSLLLIGTVLIAGIFISVFSLQATNNFFGQYIFKVREGQLDLWEDVYSQYYLYQGNWSNVENLRLMGGQMMRWQGMGRNNPRQEVVLTDISGKILAHPEIQQIGQRLDKALLVKGRPIKIDGQNVGLLFPVELLIPETRALELKFINSVISSVVLGTIITSLFAILFGLWWSRKLTRPLEELASASGEVAKGNFNHEIKIDSGDEFSSLANAFNKMAQELDKAHQLRTQLFADISHELRTPLTILGSRLETVLEKGGQLDTLQVSTLYDEVIRLQGLVKELQDLSNLEAGQVKLSIQEINPHFLAQDLAVLFEAEAEARNIQLHIDVEEQFAVLKGDQQKLKQIILNLVSNAFRYTPAQGEVFLKMYSFEQDNIIEVSDTGVGISPEDLPYIFQRFYRADKSRNRLTGGVGLGLAIAKGYIEAHRGRIEVYSEPGKGTRFKITIPKEL